MILSKVLVGDKVTRLISGRIPVVLSVTEVTEEQIVCGPWAFDKQTGLEIDDDLEWGPQYGKSGSYLITKETV